MISQATTPRLPVELLTEIISVTWHLPLSPEERLTFMKSAILVNSTWAAVYDRVSSRDVYIPSFPYCEHFIRPLRRRIPALLRDADRDDWLVPTTAPSFLQGLISLFWATPKDQVDTYYPPPCPPNLACHSITIQVVGHRDDCPKGMLPTWTGWVLELLDSLEDNIAPNLRRLSIECCDVGQDSALAALAALPEQIKHLALRFSSSEAATMHNQKRQRTIGWNAPFVTKLSIFGAEEATVRDALDACPNVRVLEVDAELAYEWVKSLDRQVQVVHCK